MKRIFVLLLFVAGSVLAGSVDNSKLSDLVGYTVIAVTRVTGDFEGADYGKTVRLDNGMIFDFTTYHYHYSYHPDVVIFAREYTAADFIRYGMKPPAGLPFIGYKLVIDDDNIYDASRRR